MRSLRPPGRARATRTDATARSNRHARGHDGSTVATTHIARTGPDGRVSCATYTTARSPAAAPGTETVYRAVAEFLAAAGTSRHGSDADVTVILDGTEVTASHVARLSRAAQP